MSTDIHVLAIVTPKLGKSERVKELLSGIATGSEAHEPGMLRYQIFEHVDSEGKTVFVVQEHYKDQEAFDKHFQTEWFGKITKAEEEEKLLAVPLDVKTIKPVGGFGSR